MRRFVHVAVGIVAGTVLLVSSQGMAQVTYRLTITRPPPAQPSAREQAATALRQQADQARRDINRAQARLRAEFESSEEVIAARASLAAAQLAYSQARRQATARLASDPGYAALQIDIHHLQTQLAHLHAQPRPRMDRIHALASLILDKRRELSRMQSELIEQDEAALTARFSMLDAASAYWQLEAEYAQRVRGDPSVAQPRRHLAEARRAIASIGS